LCGQFAGDRGKKEASKEVGEEEKKRKKKLYVEREKKLRINVSMMKSSKAAARSLLKPELL
jgi:hypothetical protein